MPAPPKLSLKSPKIPSNGDHRAFNGGALGVLVVPVWVCIGFFGWDIFLEPKNELSYKVQVTTEDGEDIKGLRSEEYCLYLVVLGVSLLQGRGYASI